MPALHGHETAAMLEAYDFSAVHLLADIGGGSGSLISAVLRRHPTLRGLLFELAHVAERAGETLKAYGVDSRCSVIEGNFFQSVPGRRRYLSVSPCHSRLERRAISPDSE